MSLLSTDNTNSYTDNTGLVRSLRSYEVEAFVEYIEIYNRCIHLFFQNSKMDFHMKLIFNSKLNIEIVKTLRIQV